MYRSLLSLEPEALKIAVDFYRNYEKNRKILSNFREILSIDYDPEFIINI